MEQDQRDKRLKYIDINQVFHNRTNDIRLRCKQSNRACEELAKTLVKAKPKDHDAFEKVERLKEYVLKTSGLNDEILGLLDYMTGFLLDLSKDAQILIDGAVIRDKLMMQSDTIEMMTSQREEDLQTIYELRKDQINSKQPG